MPKLETKQENSKEFILISAHFISYGFNFNQKNLVPRNTVLYKPNYIIYLRLYRLQEIFFTYKTVVFICVHTVTSVNQFAKLSINNITHRR